MVGYELRIQVTFTLYEQRRRPLNNGCQMPIRKKWGVPASLRAHTRRFPPSNLALPKLKLSVASRPSVVLPKNMFSFRCTFLLCNGCAKTSATAKVQIGGVFGSRLPRLHSSNVS